jgi:membrane protein implicated in regulation of membrane protease activity
VKNLRLVLQTAGAAIIAAALYYLYQRQLGAISFFVLSIFFCYLAYTQLRKRKKKHALASQKAGAESEKSQENNR